MMKNTLYVILATSALLSVSCSREEVLNTKPAYEAGCISALSSPFIGLGEDTRSVVDPTTSPISFKWSEGDQLAIYSKTGTGLTNFDLIDGIDSDKAVFKNNGFKVAAGNGYYAFSPYFSGIRTDRRSIYLDYKSQRQTANGSFDHLGAKDFQYSEAMMAESEDANDLTNFVLKHVGAVIRLRIYVPKAGIYKNVYIKSPNLSFFAALNLDAEEGSKLTLYQKGDGSNIFLGEDSYSGISLQENELLTLYMMLPPQDLSGEDITVTLNRDGYLIEKTITGKNIESGKAYGWTIGKITHEDVDLGLPSGTKWATCNIGASAPEEYGGYFAWGETETKTTYFWTNYKWCDHNGGYNQDQYRITKYCSNTAFTIPDWLDSRTELDPEDDAATVKWGSEWCTPSKEQFVELLNEENCDWTWTTQGGKNGYLVTSKKNGNSIFLPAAGFGDNIPTVSYSGSLYWSRTPHSGNTSASIWFTETRTSSNNGNYRYIGLPVRPVRK